MEVDNTPTNTETTPQLQQPNADPAATGENNGKLFTQDEVNRIVSERLNREREKAAQAAAPAAGDDITERTARLTEAENRIKCKEFLLDNKEYPSELLDLYDTKDFEAFKGNVEKTVEIFPAIKKGAKIPRFGAPTPGPTHDNFFESVFKPKH